MLPADNMLAQEMTLNEQPEKGKRVTTFPWGCAPKRRTELFNLGTIASGLLVVAVVMLGGCGYALAGRASNLPEDVNKIYVQTLENETSRAQVEQFLTQAISDELLTRRRFNVVNSAGEADAILQGKVLTFNVRPLTFDGDGLATNFEIAITADMKFARRPGPGEDEGEVLWSNSRYVFREDYPLEDDQATFFDRENIAIEETSVTFAETMVTDLLEGF